MPRFVILFAAIAFVSLAGCRDFTVDSKKESEDRPGFRQITVPSSDPFELAPGDTATIEGTNISIHFDKLISDSRCPSNVQCIQLGDAKVLMELFNGNDGGHQIVGVIPGLVPTPFIGNDVIQFQDYRFQLLQLSPYPVSGEERFEASEYRALISFTPLF